MPAIVWVVGIGVVLLVVLLLVVTYRKERERTEALRRVAETAGFAFEPKAALASVRGLGEVQLFRRGHSARVTNLMTGQVDDQRIAVFDFRYTTGSGKHQHTSAQTVVMLPSAKPSLPDLQMAPENPFHRLAEAFGYQDIDIDSCPEFSKQYLVRGANEAAIRAALYPGATSYFAEHQGWTVEVQGGTVAIYRANNRVKPDDLRAFIADALAAVRSL